jgi:hypothetical protein
MRFITLDENNKVATIRVGDVIVAGEIQSDIGQAGQIMQLDGTFITPGPTPVIPQPTNKEINDNLMVIMNGLTDIYILQLGL